MLSLSLALFLTASDFLSGFLRYLLAPEFLGLVFLGLVGVWWWMGVRALCPTDPASLEEWVGGPEYQSINLLCATLHSADPMPAADIKSALRRPLTEDVRGKTYSRLWTVLLV